MNTQEQPIHQVFMNDQDRDKPLSDFVPSQLLVMTKGVCLMFSKTISPTSITSVLILENLRETCLNLLLKLPTTPKHPLGVLLLTA